MNWTERILDFPVRAAAVDDFLRELRAHGKGDLNAVLTTLNEGGLCREAVERWTEAGWIVLAPQPADDRAGGPALRPRDRPEGVLREVAEDEGGDVPSGPPALEEESRDDEHP